MSLRPKLRRFYGWEGVYITFIVTEHFQTLFYRKGGFHKRKHIGSKILETVRPGIFVKEFILIELLSNCLQSY